MAWKTFETLMTPWIEPDSVICSDGNLAYHRDVENLVNRRCMGVSTRYLMNYFGWARRITQHRPFGSDLLAEMLAA